MQVSHASGQSPSGFSARSRSSHVLGGLIVFFLAFGVSIPLMGAYTGGDQQYYRELYDALIGTPVDQVAVVQLLKTSSAEPIYGYTMWGAANWGLEKDIVIAFFNGLLAMLIHLFLRRHNAGALASLLIFTNFYLVVLFTSAERLKFAYIFMTLAALLTGWRAVMVLFAGMGAHFQTAIVIASLISARLSRISLIQRHMRPSRLLLMAILLPAGIAAAGLFLMVFLPAIQDKIAAYSGDRSAIASLANILILLIAGLICLPRKLEFALTLLPVILAALLFGPNRVNILGVTMFIYLAVVSRRSRHPVVLVLLLYFSLKSIGFLQNIYFWGDGFYSPA